MDEAYRLSVIMYLTQTQNFDHNMYDRPVAWSLRTKVLYGFAIMSS
jgi:hypothetical protein